MKVTKLERVRFYKCCLCGFEVSTHVFEAVDMYGSKMIGLCCDECTTMTDEEVWELRLIGKELAEL